jgi:hypothetical protein
VTSGNLDENLDIKYMMFKESHNRLPTSLERIIKKTSNEELNFSFDFD